jgi:hypothetical protein
MLSNKSSRSPSVSSLLSAENDFISNPPGVEVQPPVEEYSYDVPPNNEMHYRYTVGHPQGAALLKIIEDLTNIAKRNNVKSMATNVDEFCTSFYNAMRLERAKTNQSIEQRNHEIEMNMVYKELNSHKINATIDPPDNFSAIPVITTATKLAEVNKVFPRQNKFAGFAKDGGMGIVEFLNCLNTAQEQCKLSEPEFINRILAGSTGPAHDLILEWKANGMDAAAIYHNLLVNYDRRLTPEDARARLISYKVGRNGSLAEAESKIIRWIGRAAVTYPIGESRSSYYNLEGCNALIRALPPYSSQIANNLYSSLTAKLGRACTLLELSQGLNLHRSNIDKDIKEHGSQMMKTKPMHQTKIRFRTPVKYSVNSVEASPPTHNPKPIFKKRTENSYTPRPKPLMKNFQNKGNFSSRKINNNRPSWKKNTNFKRGNFSNNRLQTNKCLQCGLRDHTSKDCKNIRDDKGNPVQMISGYGVCSKCPRYIFPRLHHSEELCPYRPKGPLAKRN